MVAFHSVKSSIGAKNLHQNHRRGIQASSDNSVSVQGRLPADRALEVDLDPAARVEEAQAATDAETTAILSPNPQIALWFETCLRITKSVGWRTGFAPWALRS